MDDDTADEEYEGSEQGYLAGYGVTIVPPSALESGGWFVTLSRWNQDGDNYYSLTDGPIFETREEALDEANKVLDWIAEQRERDDLMQIWERMQRDRTRYELEEGEPRTFGKWW